MTIQNQTLDFGPVEYTENGQKYRIAARVRHDDSCNNGHNTFAITADIDEWRGNRWRESAGGCCRDEVAKHFPNLAPLIKWHLCSTDGPMHYPGNALYHAGDKDCWGKRKGEVLHTKTRISFGDNPIRLKGVPEKFALWLKDVDPYSLEVLRIEYDGKSDYAFSPKYTFTGYGTKWHDCPFDGEQEALNFLSALKHHNPQWHEEPTAWSEGKDPDLSAARSCAIWPDATLEQLQDKAALEARLPGLIADFREAVESLGLKF